MKRIAARVILLLLLGAIVNVAVAWGCAAWLSVANAPLAYPDGGPLSSSVAPCWSVDFAHRPGAARYVIIGVTQIGEHDIVQQGEVPHWSRAHSIPLSENTARNDVIVEDARGFPKHSLHCEILLAVTDSVMPWATDVIGGIPLNQASWPGMPAAGSIYIRSPFMYARALPLRPIWTGFAINTIFYAAVLWVLFFAPGKLRRTIRRRRGLCPAYAYPVGTSPVCTECGKAV